MRVPRDEETQLQAVLDLVEAAGQDELGSFLERLDLDNARAQWKSLADEKVRSRLRVPGTAVL